jgi:hypothetical protein
MVGRGLGGIRVIARGAAGRLSVWGHGSEVWGTQNVGPTAVGRRPARKLGNSRPETAPGTATGDRRQAGAVRRSKSSET